MLSKGRGGELLLIAVEVVVRTPLSEVEVVRVIIVVARFEIGSAIHSIPLFGIEYSADTELDKNPPMVLNSEIPEYEEGIEEDCGNAANPNALKYSGGRSLEYI